ncbi:MAG TPA: ATP phosphoribosyltransferase regulatory subunit [Caulobacteraceae bacterium]|jgi:ATP phosphoribosyltransferase regulatory subunit|nr:ATP phosphoribosyltransferase regulatory subunit [Caulobacteraceae bacterium]
MLEPPIPPEAMAAIRAPFIALGAARIDTPVMQPLGLLLDLAGEAMRSRLFVIQGEAGAETCLRADFTIPVVREHIAAGSPARRYVYEGKAFRVAPRGSDHPEEFLQIGLEAFGGGAGPEADAEVASLAWRAASVGGRGDLGMILGDVSLFGAFIDALGLAEVLASRLKRAFSHPRALQAELARARNGVTASRQGDRLSRLIAGLPEDEACAVLEELWALAGIQPVGGRSAGEIVHRLVERAGAAAAPRLSAAESDLVQRYLAVVDHPRRALERIGKLGRANGGGLDAALAAWSRRLDALAAGGAPEDRLSLATGFIRAFGYYDGFLFEIRSAALGEDTPVAGGGRYDGLPTRLGGAERAAGAVGCMVRPARAWAGAA